VDNLIRETISRLTAINKHSEDTGWKEPLVAYASADDPLFAMLKQTINPTHALPHDFLPEAQTVIAYFLPFKDDVVDSNIAGHFSSRTWALAYIETNRLIGVINQHLQGQLIALGYKAVFVPANHNFNQKTLLSDWSHRSAAYIAGLGTFGFNHMLITEKGCCGRIGSLITDLELQPTPRYTRELCLYKQDRSCQRCAQKCVNTALGTDGLDKHKCYEMCLINAARFNNLESTADICGKCLAGVPCSVAAPSSHQPV
jgi:epoxyqueuosine reductase QueG